MVHLNLQRMHHRQRRLRVWAWRQTLLPDRTTHCLQPLSRSPQQLLSSQSKAAYEPHVYRPHLFPLLLLLLLLLLRRRRLVRLTYFPSFHRHRHHHLLLDSLPAAQLRL
jgi:hypothetical protein